MSTITIDLRMAAQERVATDKALAAVEAYLARPVVQRVLGLWPGLPEDVRAEILARAPIFARVVAIRMGG